MMKRFVLTLSMAVAMMLSASTASALQLNEMRLNGTIEASADYVELKGTPSESLDDVWFLSVYGDGTIYQAFDLTGQSIPADRAFFTFGDDYFGSAHLDYVTGGIYDGGGYTYMLVDSFTGSTYDDTDANDDGTMDYEPWTSIIDSVSLDTEQGSPFLYSPTVIPDWSQYDAAPHVYREDDGPTWTFWDDSDALDYPMPETPQASNSAVSLVPANGTGTFSFEGGDIEIEITGNTSGVQLCMNVIKSDTVPSHGMYSNGAQSPDGTMISPNVVSDNIVYTVEVGPDFFSGVTYSITLDATGQNGILDLDKVVILVSHGGGSWLAYETTRNGNLFTATGLTGFSDFSFGSNSIYQAMPVELDNFAID